MDTVAAIAQYMKQAGVCNYSVRPFSALITDGFTLPAGKYYYIDVSKMDYWRINANNIYWNCYGKSYSLSYNLPIFQGQAHFIGGTLEVTEINKDTGLPETKTVTVLPIRVSIIEITPLSYESSKC